jgi:hypothetical protein
MTPEELDRLAGGASFYDLYLVSIAKAALAASVPDLQLRFLQIIEKLVRAPITPPVAAAVDPAPAAAIDVFREAAGNRDVLHRPEVRRLLATLNPSLILALQLIDRRVAA